MNLILFLALKTEMPWRCPPLSPIRSSWRPKQPEIRPKQKFIIDRMQLNLVLFNHSGSIYLDKAVSLVKGDVEERTRRYLDPIAQCPMYVPGWFNEIFSRSSPNPSNFTKRPQPFFYISILADLIQFSLQQESLFDNVLIAPQFYQTNYLLF